MRKLSPAWLVFSSVLVLCLVLPASAKAQCRPESSFNVPDILDVYAKRHSNGTTTLWFVHKIGHEVVCNTVFCSDADEYVWRSGSSGNSNISSLTAVDTCGESWTLTPSNPSTTATAVMRIKFGENYYAQSPPVHHDRRKNFDVIVDPSQVFWCECIFQLNCNASTGACGGTATLLGSPTNCSIC